MFSQTSLFANVEFQHIKNRRVAQFELTEIILNLSSRDSLYLLDRWREISPRSFRGLDFTKAYLVAADRVLENQNTNTALQFYIKSYQALDKNYFDKVVSAYKASLILYAQKKRPEALFYIKRATSQLKHFKKEPHPFQYKIASLKRRIVWRYFSRLEYLPDNAISAITFDGDDVWIGMWSGGVARFSRSSSQLDLFHVRNAAIPSNYIRDILVQGDKVWVTTDRGMSFYQKTTGTWNKVSFFNGYKLKRLIYDGQHIYVATLFRGVFRSADGVNWQNVIPKQSVLDLLKIDDELYIATPERGVYRMVNGVTEQFLPEISAKTIVTDINPKFLWIGTYGQGLLRVNRATGKIVQTFTREQLGSDYIESLLVVDKKLWIGTLESGVKVYDPRSKDWESISLREGLPGLDITTITKENDYIWFGTLAGGIGIYLFQDKEG
ncbi:MAG: ligand-binding sensor domain-containing protein [Brevinema sp.]